MTKNIFVTLVCLFSIKTFAFEVSCVCEDKSCKEVRVASVESEGPGRYLKVEMDNGLKHYEGYAQIRRDISKNQIVYSLQNFSLIKQGDIFSMLDKRRQCLEI